MKHTLLSVLFALLAGSASAQGGGFGHFSIGSAVSGFGSLEKDLSVPSLMGTVSLKTSGICIGGGGYGVIGEHFMLGGKGFAASFPKAFSGNSSVQCSQGWGFFNFGYMKKLKGGINIYGYGGVGGGGASAKIDNQSGNTWVFGSTQLKSGESATFDAGNYGLDVGLGIFRFFPSESGGFKLGLEIGRAGMSGSQNWENSNQAVPNLSPWNPGMFYFTLSVGGGGVSDE